MITPDNLLATKPKKLGRPSKADKQKLADGQNEFVRLVELYEQGASDVEVCADLKMPWREFEKRIKADDIFCQLVEFGRLAAKAWWLRQSRLAVNDKTFQYSVWFAHMTNRYGWSNKTTENTEQKPMEQMSKDELEKNLSDALKKGKGKIAKFLAVKNVEVSDKEEIANGSS